MGGESNGNGMTHIEDRGFSGGLMNVVSDICIRLRPCNVEGECHLVGNDLCQLVVSIRFGKEERSDFQGLDRSIKTGITENWEISSCMVKWKHKVKRRVTHPMNVMARVAVVATVQYPLYVSPPAFSL